MATYYGTGADELHLAFNFPFVFAALRADELGAVIEATEEALPTSAWPVWTGSNHDVGRPSTRWCDGDERRVRCALLLLLTLRGTPVLYAGDEIGLTDVEVPRERLLDPVGVRGWPDEPGRDRCRTPMRWTADAGAGFTAPGAEPWLPLGSDDLPDVADQRDDPRSTLWFTRELISLRRSWRALHAGDYERVDAPAGMLAWRRGRDALVALNFSDEAQGLDGVAGTVVLSTTREREGDAVRRLELAPWTGAVVRIRSR
jgi:alpha-glucosidase